MFIIFLESHECDYSLNFNWGHNIDQSTVISQNFALALGEGVKTGVIPCTVTPKNGWLLIKLLNLVLVELLSSIGVLASRNNMTVCRIVLHFILSELFNQDSWNIVVFTPVYAHNSRKA